MIGQTIAHYRILEHIARGGMGEVYLALDMTLDRKVALKLLPQEVERDLSARRRFLREAKAAAALDHPFIAHIHEVGEIKGKSFIAMEFVKGETLQERLRKGPLPLQRVLQLGAEIAEALEEARRQGIIHRDLKPSNVMITEAGHAKVTDFGLAKLVRNDSAETPEASLTGLTATGVRLGTMSYMSPEQLRGEELDTRSDIFSFGILLYEMIVGVHPFKREDPIQTAGAILKEEPPPIVSSESANSQVLAYVIGKMLAKEKRQRYQTPLEIQTDLLGLLNEVRLLDRMGTGPLRRSRQIRRYWPKLAVVLLLVLGAAALLPWFYRPVPSNPVISAEIQVPEGDRLAHYYRHGFAISPQDDTLAIVSGEVANPYLFPNRSQIFLRKLDQWHAVPLSGTKNGIQPFFSPDGRWIGFTQYDPVADEWFLKRVPRAGGEATTICRCQARWGAVWTDRDTIIFGSEQGGLQEVAAGGGRPHEITQLDEAQGESSHRLPRDLPGGRGVIFTSPKTADALGTEAEIYVQTLDSGERKLLVEGWDGRYVPSGHLLFVRDGVLLAAPFDLDALEVVGEAVPVIEGITHSLCTVSTTLRTGAAQFAVSDSGLLVYTEGEVFPEIKGPVVWVDQEGEETLVDLPERNYFSVRLSPSAEEILATTVYPPQDVWLYDLVRRTYRRQTFEANDLYIAWGPTPEEFTFSSDLSGPIALFTKTVDSGPGQERLLIGTLQPYARPGFWSPALGKLTLVQANPDTRFDILLADTKGNVEVVLKTRFSEQYPEISPDGRWLLYASNESGEHEVYVRNLADGARAIQISTEGGIEPAWSRDGRSVFYRWRREFFRVPLTPSAGGWVPGSPVKLFEGDYGSSWAVRSYDVAPDGRLLLLKRPNDEVVREAIEAFFPGRIRIVSGWLQELEQRVKP